jgi:hypothetical protein
MAITISKTTACKTPAGYTIDAGIVRRSPTNG